MAAHLVILPLTMVYFLRIVQENKYTVGVEDHNMQEVLHAFWAPPEPKRLHRRTHNAKIHRG